MATHDVTEGHISTQAVVANGKPCIIGTRIRVQDVYIWHEVLAQSADTIASEYNLSLAQIYAALTYAFDHLDDIRMAIRELDDFVDTLKLQYPSKLPKND